MDRSIVDPTAVDSMASTDSSPQADIAASIQSGQSALGVNPVVQVAALGIGTSAQSSHVTALVAVDSMRNEDATRIGRAEEAAQGGLPIEPAQASSSATASPVSVSTGSRAELTMAETGQAVISPTITLPAVSGGDQEGLPLPQSAA